MFSLIVFLLFSAGMLLWSIWVFGPVLTVPLLIATLGVVLGVIQLVRLKIWRPANWVVVDGSNVLYWENDEPALQSVRLVIEKLVSEGFEPIVWFDANIGYLVMGRYMNPARLSRVLRFPVRQIRVAPKGTPADPLLITDAAKLNARIVTNDRFRDWEEQFPRVTQQDLFLRGTIRKKSVYFK